MSAATGTPIPMFPLGGVLFPGGVLPLHVFEARYRRLVDDCLAGDRRFGTVLIERGHEVGGGDRRFEAGTRCEIVESHRFEDGRWALLARGLERIRVTRWLPDDPYPRAEVAPVDERGDVDGATLERVAATLRRALALTAEAGRQAAPATLDLPADPPAALDAMCATAPVPSLDAHHLLAEVDRGARVRELERLLVEAVETLTLTIDLGE